MKFSSRSTNKPARPARVAVLGAYPPDAHFMQRLNAALHTSVPTRQVLVSSAMAPAADESVPDLTLVMALDDSHENLRASDSAIRRELARRGTSYHVLYGTASERLSQALQLIGDNLPEECDAPPDPIGQQNRASLNTRWVWACDKCSDPECEHRLLTDLLAAKAGSGY